MDSALVLIASLISAAVAAVAVFFLAALWALARRRRFRRREVEARILAARAEIVLVDRLFRIDLPILFDDIIRDLVRRAKLDAGQVLRNAGRAVDEAERFSRRSPDGSAEIMAEAERQIEIARQMFRTVDEAVAESRAMAGVLLAEVADLHARTAEEIERRLGEGYPFRAEAVEVSLLAFDQLADKYAVEGDPFGVLCRLSVTVARLAAARYAVGLRVALTEHIEEAIRSLPGRIETAARLLPAAISAIVALQNRRPDQRWNDLLKTMQDFPSMLDGVRVRLEAAGVTCRADELKQRAALVGVVMAEASLDLVEGHVAAILNEWTETFGAGGANSDNSRS